MEEINKFLTEKMGECWHIHSLATEDIWGIKCDKCGIIVTPNLNNDFLTWEGFGKLWEWAVEQEWWNDFTTTFTIDGVKTPWIPWRVINPDWLAKAVADFLQKK